ncbi:MAG: hypothetical protein CVV05_01015 [Gammaproteobacteria bacterium HGW-Gammaproteobacteria-1]|jgi:uncharacterized membrane protein|nr:MAG: hypothetical protein CVV05_01015 [Gammaproteobacteria bacterium HGW-Gammaproteobacteria-1]
MSNTVNQDIKNGALYAYICYAVGVFLPIVTIAGIVINFIKRDDASGTWVESHHRWMMRTFFFSLLWALLMFVAAFIPLVNVLVVFAFIGLAIWYVYRIVRGFLAFNSEKAMYSGTAAAAVATAQAGS